MSATALVVALASGAPDPADVKPGWLGFGVFLALAAAVVLLWLSMRRQLKKVDFVEESDPEPRAPSPATSPATEADPDVDPATYPDVDTPVVDPGPADPPAR